MATQDDIMERINQRLTIEANKLEGGFSQQIIGSVSYEIANIIDVDIPNIIDANFVKTAKGEDLDKVASDYGLYRIEATPANVMLEITGAQGSFVNNSVQAVYDNLVFTVAQSATIGATGKVTVRAVCNVAGTIGNVEPNTITQFTTQYAGLTAVNNPQAGYDGFDRETDDEFRARILAFLAEDATNANEGQYRQWALSVAGVAKAVILSAEDMGAGNVGVYIASKVGTVSDELIQAVKDYIESVQPINATLIVNALDYVDIDINADLVLASGYTPENVEAELRALLAEYLQTVENVVSYFKVSDLLYQCSGVEDVNGFLLNNGTESLHLNKTEYPVVGEVTINA